MSSKCEHGKTSKQDVCLIGSNSEELLKQIFYSEKPLGVNHIVVIGVGLQGVEYQQHIDKGFR